MDDLPKNRTVKPRQRSPSFYLAAKAALLAAVLAAAFTWVLGIHIVHGCSMHPRLEDGDFLITFRLDAYRVGDAVVYRDSQSGSSAVSRIAAAGAHQVDITEQGSLLIDGAAPEEGVYYPTFPAENSTVTYPLSLGEKEYFLLDDYRTQGYDSRVFGPVPEEELLGKVVYVFRLRGI